MRAHPLDRPIWDALAHRHAGFALGGSRARRYRADISPFAAARDSSPEALAALAALLPAEGGAVLLEAGTIAVPPGAIVEKQAWGVQMIAEALEPDEPDDRVVTLTDANAPEMLALATLTEPGPFLANTHMFGGFIGIRIDGRLAAMAGERLKPQGHCEVSGVCTHPDFRGRASPACSPASWPTGSPRGARRPSSMPMRPTPARSVSMRRWASASGPRFRSSSCAAARPNVSVSA